MPIIFDLDQTLVDSTIARRHRDSRQWQEVYELIPSFLEYKGIRELFNLLYNADIKIAIVTSAPDKYCKQVIQYFGWKIDYTVTYYDTQNRKPHPEPIEKAIVALGGGKTLSLGDDPRDIIASNKAGAISVACTWGADNKDILLSSKPDYLCNSVSEVIQVIEREFNL